MWAAEAWVFTSSQALRNATSEVGGGGAVNVPGWDFLAPGVHPATAKILVELVEYPLLYSDEFHYSAYYDTLADMASTLVGGVVGAVVGAYDFDLYRRRWI